MRAAILFPFSFPLLFSQVDERMNKIRYPGEDLRDSTRLLVVFASALRRDRVYTAGLRNIIISLGKINNYGVYTVTSLRPSHCFYLFAR